MDDKTLAQEFELLHPVPLEMAFAVRALFSQTWWAKDRDLIFTKKVLMGSSHSWALMKTENRQLLGFARVVSDGIAKATIYDVILDDSLHGRGLGAYFLNQVIASPILQEVDHVEL